MCVWGCVLPGTARWCVCVCVSHQELQGGVSFTVQGCYWASQHVDLGEQLDMLQDGDTQLERRERGEREGRGKEEEGKKRRVGGEECVCGCVTCCICCCS